MSFYDAIRVGASGAAEDFVVERSLRFNDGDSAHLSRTPSSAGNRKTFTWSAWIKRGELGVTQGRCFGGGVSGSDYFEIYFPSDDGLRVIWYQGGQTLTTTTAKFRDPSAWYHFVVAVDTTQSTAGDRIKMYRNNVLLERDSTNPSQNLDTSVNNTVEHNIGKYLTGNASYFDGYMAEINFVDGSALTPSSFAETSADTGQWIPKKPSVTYGTNGFRLNFSDNSGTSATTLGKDSSGNGNNFTPNNFSVSTGTGNDSMKDTPTNNFATFNSVFETASSASYGNGNLEFSTSSTGQKLARSSFAHNSGKWYAEFKLVSYSFASGSYPYIGVTPANKADPYGDHNTWVGYIGTAVNTAGTAYKNGSVISGGFSYAAGDIIGMAMDVDNLLVYFYKNGTIQNSGSGYALTSDSDKGYQFAVSLYANSGTWAANLGGIGIGSNSDANGHGNFTYSVPSGYLAECSANLSDPTILLPNKHFDTVLYTGTGATLSISSLNFGPDWIWLKRRDSAHSHGLFDSVRGPHKLLYSDLTNSESSFGSLQAFNSDGFTLSTGGEGNTSSGTYVAWNWDAGETDSATYTVKVVSDSGNKYRFNNFGTSAVTLDLTEGGTYTFDGSDSSMAGHPFVIGTAANGSVYSTGVTYQLDGASVTYSAYTSGYSSATTRKLIITVPASAPQLYYWCSIHSGMGGAINTNTTLGSSNFDGSVQATVKANVTAGFSIITAEAPSSGTNFTVGHGLGVAPNVIFSKSRETAQYWAVFHDKTTDTIRKYLQLNSTLATTTSGGDMWGSALPTSSVIGLSSANAMVASQDFVCYCFSEVEGYSKFGSYTGNGSSNGTFVYTGFRVRWVMIKRTNSAGSWAMYDTARDPSNLTNEVLFADLSNAEATASSGVIDILSNGFKPRGTSAMLNNNNSTYVYFAFAESPFKNARAR